MTDPWAPPERSPVARGGPTEHAPYGPPNRPYWQPSAPPPRRRRTGLIAFAVVGVVVLVVAVTAVAVVVASNVGGNSSHTADGQPVKLRGPAGTVFPIVLPPGFRQNGDSDPRDGFLAAGVGDGDVSPYIDAFTGSEGKQQGVDLVGLAMAVQDENAKHGAKVTAPIHNVTIHGLLVAQWQESYAGTDDADPFSQLNAVVDVGSKREYVVISYYDYPEDYSVADAERVVAAMLAALGPPK